MSLRLLVDGRDLTDLVDEGWTFSNTDPGGYETLSFSAPKRVYIRKGAYVRAEEGCETAWEGRVDEVGDQLAGARSRSISCLGYGVAAKETNIAAIYRDCDLSHWAAATLQRKIDFTAAGLAGLEDPIVDNDPATLVPALTTALTGPWSVFHLALSQYDAHDIPIGAVYYGWKKGGTINAADVNWSWSMELNDNDRMFSNLLFGLSSQVSTGNLRAAGPGSGYLFASTLNQTWIELNHSYGAAGGSSGLTYPIYWTDLVVYGQNRLFLELIGTDPDAGLPAPSIARHAASQLPGVAVGEFAIDRTFPVRQAVYWTPVPIEQILDDMAKLLAWHYGTWAAPVLGGQPQLDFVPRPTKPTAIIPLTDWQDDLSFAERLSDVYDSIVLTWQDTAGRDHTTTVTKPQDELDRFAIDRQLPADVGISTEAATRALGTYLLALQNRLARATGGGSVRMVRVPGGGKKAAHLLRAGRDRVLVPDLPDLPLFADDAARREFHIGRVETTVGRDGPVSRLDLGLGADLVEVLNARIEQEKARFKVGVG